MGDGDRSRRVICAGFEDFHLGEALGDGKWQFRPGAQLQAAVADVIAPVGRQPGGGCSRDGEQAEKFKVG